MDFYIFCFAVAVYIIDKSSCGTIASTTTTTESPVKCEPDTCPSSAVKCHDEEGYIWCECPPGKVGLDCDIDDPCAVERTEPCPEGRICEGNCPPNIQCTGGTGHAHCRGCVEGYTGMDCLTDVNECDIPGFCKNGGTCTNHVGGFECNCADEYIGDMCECKTGTECDPNVCKADSCPVTATCHDDEGYVWCECPKGKVGAMCDKDDPCLQKRTAPCPKGRTCVGNCPPNMQCIVNYNGDAQCTGCVEGYTNIDCLTDLDECVELPDVCQNNATCINKEGTYECKCTEEFVGKDCTCRKGTICDNTPNPGPGSTASTFTASLLFPVLLALEIIRL